VQVIKDYKEMTRGEKMNLVDAIDNRVSVRTYQNKQISNDDIIKIKSILSNHKKKKGPFDHSFDLTFNINSANGTDGKRIGTYGVLKNVPAFIGGVCQNTTESIIDFGYVFEHIILNFTAQGFGTCWLGGTFKRRNYRKVLEDTEVIPAISPIGYIAPKRSLVEKLMRNGAKSDNRLPFNDLFVDSHLNPLTAGLREDITNCLRMVRKAPSASNKQPWRVIVDDDKKYFHFYMARTKNYASPLKYDIQALDIGIALAHFEIGLEYYGINFTREKLELHPFKAGWEYTISLKLS